MIDYRIFTDIKLVKATVTDPFYINDLNLHFEQLLAEPTFIKGTNGLYDFTAVTTVHGCPNDFVPLATAIEDRNNVPERAKVAIICHQGSTICKVLEGYQLMVTDALVEYRFFSELQSAEDWLNS